MVVLSMITFYRLDRSTGQLYINGTLMSGNYRFKVRVYDVVMRREVISSVAVTVKDITDEAIVNSGSLRIHGRPITVGAHEPEFESAQ